MNAEIIELFPRTRFKFTNLGANRTIEVPMVRAIDVSEFADLVLLVRVHDESIAGGSIEVIVRSISPTCDDPSTDFVGSAAAATVTLDSGSAAGDLEVAALSPDFGGHLQVHVKGSQPTDIDVDATISAELVARPNARAATLGDSAASEITDSSSSAGAASTVSRADHVHSHGSRGGGSLHSAATTSTAGFMSSADKTKLDNLPMTPTAVTSTTSAGTNPALYLCSPSSSTMDIDLPAASGNSGLRIGVKLVNSNGTTRTARLDPSGSETIDGKTTVTLYVDGDYLEVECDGSTWHVVVDGRIAHRALMRRSSGQSIPNNTTTTIAFNSEDVDIGAIADTSTGTVTVKRAGSYLVSASCRLPNIDDTETMNVVVAKNGTWQNRVSNYASGSNQSMEMNLTLLLELAASDAITVLVYHNEGAAQTTVSTTYYQPRLSVVEVMPSAVP